MAPVGWKQFTAALYIACVMGACMCLPLHGQSGHDTPKNRYIVLQVTRLGLANRLRTLADMHSIAVTSGRKLLLSWKPSYDCNATFFDLFEGWPPSMEVLPLVLDDGDKGVLAVKGMAAENGLSYQLVSRAALSEALGAQVDFFWPQDVFASDIDVLHTTYDGVITTTEFSLIPVSSIRGMVKDVDDTYFHDRIAIGVHIRGHDTRYDWEVVPPAAGTNTAQAFGQGATLGDFEAAMTSISRHFGADRVRFFISSNFPDAKKHMQSTFKDSIALFGDNSRSSAEGVQFALMELLLLGRTSLLLHTFGSTYAMEAAYINLRPIVGIFSGQLIRHTDISLYFCGIQGYIKQFSQNAKTISYVEGTSDRRKVEGKEVVLRLCSDNLDSWGLVGVYCHTAV